MRAVDIDRLLDALDKKRVSERRPAVYPYECEIPCTACEHRHECVRFNKAQLVKAETV